VIRQPNRQRQQDGRATWNSERRDGNDNGLWHVTDRQTDSRTCCYVLEALWVSDGNDDRLWDVVVLLVERVGEVGDVLGHVRPHWVCPVTKSTHTRQHIKPTDSAATIHITIAIYYYYSAQSWYSFYCPWRVEGWVDLGTAGRMQQPVPKNAHHNGSQNKHTEGSLSHHSTSKIIVQFKHRSTVKSMWNDKSKVRSAIAASM